MAKKYKMLKKEETEEFYQIRAVRDIPKHNVHKGDYGAKIQDASCLSQDGDCWAGPNLIIYAPVKISGNALITGNGELKGNIIIKE